MHDARVLFVWAAVCLVLAAAPAAASADPWSGGPGNGTACAQVGYDVGPMAAFNPFWTLQEAGVAACLDVGLEKQLRAAPMKESLEQRKVAIPVAELAGFVAQPQYWPQWNILFSETNMTGLEVCRPLDAGFHILPDIAFGGAQLGLPTVVRADADAAGLHFSWQYRFAAAAPPSLPVAFGRHDYLVAAGDCGADPSTSWLLSWEKGGGPAIASNVREEEHTLRKATLAAMDGLSCLEAEYAASGRLAPADVFARCGQSPHLQCLDLVGGGIYLLFSIK